MKKNLICLVVMSSVLLSNFAHGSVITEAESNNSLLNAQNIDSFFSSDFSNNIGDEAGENNSLTTRHVTINANGDTGSTYDYFSFTVSEGEVGYFDIDFGYDGTDTGGSVDLELALWDSAFNVLIQNDDFGVVAGDQGSIHFFDAFIGPYGFVTPGLYYVGVAGFSATADDGGWDPSSVVPNADKDYTLQVALKTVPVPASFWLMGSAVFGLVGMGRKKKVK